MTADRFGSVSRRSACMVLASVVSGHLQAATGKLVLTGASTVAPLALEIGKRFESLNPGLRVDVQSGGSARGVSDVRAGLSDIGLVSRPLKPEEQDLTARTLAMDGVSIILHRSNPVAALSAEQVRGLYLGQIRNWKELGGEDRAVTVVNKAEGRSTLELFVGYYQLKNSDIRAQVVIGDNQQGIKTVAGNPGAIGYVSIGAAEFEAGDGAAIKLLPMNGVEATTEAVRAGRFPLSRPLNLVTRGPASGLAARFIDFACSTKVNDLVKEFYFVSLAR
jgi:phosphate transport system substrate-binding protein